MRGTHDEISNILRGTDYSAKEVGPFWQIRVGRRAGAREDGISLANELLKSWRDEKAAQPNSVEVVEDPSDREVLEKAEAKMTDAAERLNGAKAPAYKFNETFLRAEMRPGETTLHEVDKRLSREYGEMEVRRPLPDEQRPRWDELNSKLYTYKG